MDTELNVSLIQSDITWQDKEANLTNFEHLIDSIAETTDLIVLPEMFTTGFSMEPALLAETMDGDSVAWMAKMAKDKQAVVCGSLIIVENEKYYNRFIWMRPDGTFETYNKRHLFRMSTENDNYTPGNNRLIVELKGWRIMPLVCYDLRFPVWSRNCNEYDALIYVANWPTSRSFVWNHLLVARALENQAYVIGVNRIGEDVAGTSYRGESVAVSPKGNLLSTIQPNMYMVETVSLSKDDLLSFRETFPVWKDGDEFEILL